MGETIEIISCESDDWKILKVDGEDFVSHHNISEFHWLKLLEKLGFRVKSTLVTDEEMEKMC